MKHNLLLMIIIIILFLVLFMNKEECFINKEECDRLNIIHFNYSKKPKLVIIGGVHGNEYGPVYGIEKFINNNIKRFNKGNVIFIPRVNNIGVLRNTRYYDCVNTEYDINRHFDSDIKVNSIEDKIINIIKDADYVIDFHEGYDFHKLYNTSIGSTISDTSSILSKKVSKYLVLNINKYIKEDYKKFTLIQNKEEIKNSLRYYCDKNNINYSLVEITGQLNKQPLETRILQTNIILNYFFKYFKY